MVNSIRVQISIKDSLLQQIDAYCAEHGMSRSRFIANACTQSMSPQDKVQNCCAEILAAVDERVSQGKPLSRLEQAFVDVMLKSGDSFVSRK